MRRQQEETRARCICRDEVTAINNSIKLLTNNVSNAINQLSMNISNMFKTLDLMVTCLEETCRSKAQGSKRRHEDRDDLGYHEGETEKKRRLDSQSASKKVGPLTEVHHEGTDVGPTESTQQVDALGVASENTLTVEKAVGVESTTLSAGDMVIRTKEEAMAISFLQDPNEVEFEDVSDQFVARLKSDMLDALIQRDDNDYDYILQQNAQFIEFPEINPLPSPPPEDNRGSNR